MVISDLSTKLQEIQKQEGDVRVVTCSSKRIHGKGIVCVKVKVDYPNDPYDRETVLRLATYIVTLS